VTIISINVIANSILDTSYESLENKKMNTNIQRFHNALNNELNQLDAAVGDWSYWNDTYMFVGGEYNEYPENNLDNATLTNLRTDIMIFVNKSGNIVYEKEFDYSDQKMINVSSSLNNYIYKDSILVNFVDINSSIKGILQLPEGPILIVSRPITTNNRQGPIRGSIIWGRYLDSDELNYISNTVNLPVSIANFNDQASAPDFRKAALSLIKNDGDIFIKPLDSDYIAGYSTINNLFGQPVLLVRVVMDRDIYKQGMITIQYFQILIVVLGIILCITVIFYLDKILLSRLNNLSQQVQNISKKNDFSTRINIPGNDELNELANVANDTIKIITDMNTNLEQKVLERTKKIDLLLKQKNDFINQLGHDLKNPLNPLVNLLPILEKNERNQKNKEIIGVLIRNATYMKNLVTKTIELGRLNSSKTTFTFEDINLVTELNTIIDNNKTMLHEKHIKIKKNIPDDIMVNVDKLQFDELLNNLLTNAVKYTNGSGTITMDAKQNPTFVTISIKDTGIGMSDQQLHNIFNEFYKADESRHDFDSSGLGLPICKRIVERHNGEIWAESEGLGKGSTFYFTVPKSKLKNQSTPMEYIYKEIDKIDMMKTKNQNWKIKRSDIK
jgi:signal transduction histidine kinase